MAMGLVKNRLRVGLSFVFISLMLWTLGSAWAQALPSVDISGFRGEYLNDRGNAFAETWQVPNIPSANQVSFEVFKESTQFRFTGMNSEFLWENVPEFLLDLNQMKWSQVSVKSGANSLEAVVYDFFGRHPQHSLVLKGMGLNCQKGAKSIIHTLIETCLYKGRLGFSLLETKSQTSFQYSLKNLLAKELEGPSPKAQSALKLENLDFRISKGTFNLAVRAHLDITLNLKANGVIKFRKGPTPKSGELELRIDKVKAGFLTVTGKVFDELEKINDPNIRVSRPFVTITFP
jgi:hypothetical protein